MERRSPLGLPVLIVDDDELWLRAFSRLVKPLAEGSVQAETDVARALDSIARGAPGIVLTDLDMHGDSGAGIAIVEAAQRAGIPVAVVSNGAASEERSRLAGVRIFDKTCIARDSFDFLGELSAWRLTAAPTLPERTPDPARRSS